VQTENDQTVSLDLLATFVPAVHGQSTYPSNPPPACGPPSAESSISSRLPNAPTTSAPLATIQPDRIPL
jgi:hypothetical protein